MVEHRDRPPRAERGADLIRGAVLLCLLGTVLGVAYNASGRVSRPQFGLAWLASDRFADLPSLEAAPASDLNGVDARSFTTSVSDPMAIGAAPRRTAVVPDVPDLDRPRTIQLEAAKQFFDAGAAWFVDARDKEECDASRIAGAVCLPYDEIEATPTLLNDLGADGRPIIAYCGGGLCEVSLGVAQELIDAGYSKVLVYTGGFDQWADAGYPVDRGIDGRMP